MKNRPFIFRAWDGTQMITAACITFAVFPDPNVPVSNIVSPAVNNPDGTAGFSRVNIEDACIMQYTGLNDKHGKMIYEGDVLRFPECDCYVEWSCGMFETVGTDHGERDPLGDSYLSLCEVIGNIYESPELIEP